MSRRALQPRPAAVVAPATVSQLTSLSVLGVDERRYLEMVVPRCRGVARVGHLRIVEVEEAMRALRGLAPSTAEGERESTPAPGEEDEYRTVDTVLARLGRRRCPR